LAASAFLSRGVDLCRHWAERAGFPACGPTACPTPGWWPSRTAATALT